MREISSGFIAPFRILKKLGSNAYLLDLPYNVPTSPIFNIADLSMFNGDSPEATQIDALPFVDSTKGVEDVIEDIIDIKTTKTRGSMLRKYLVRWRDRLTDRLFMD